MHVLYSFPTRLGTSGIGMTGWQQVCGLVERGLRVTLLCGSCERPIRGLHWQVETMRLGPLPMPYRLLGLDGAMRWHDRRVARHLRREGRDVDIVHVWPSGALATLTEARRADIPTVLERPSAHTAQVYEVVARETQRIGMRVSAGHYTAWNGTRLKREQEEFSLADMLLCPSEAAAETFISRGHDPRRIALHQYGYDPEVFNLDGRVTQARRPFTAIFVGECSPLKALHVSLLAWEISGIGASSRFLICGRLVPGYQQALGRLLELPGVSYVGFTSDVGSLMRQSDVLVHPSFSEGSALVTYEAQACGLALLASDVAGARCTHGVDGLIHRAGDKDELASHLLKVSSDDAFLCRLQRASAERSRLLTWSHAAERLHQIYHEARKAHVSAPGGRSIAPSNA